jgi:hypothetical protein
MMMCPDRRSASTSVPYSQITKMSTPTRPDTLPSYLAVQDHVNGKVVDWMEKVTDEQYAGAATR